MLQLYPSNKTESLAYLIAEIIDRHPLQSVFAEDLILIQSQGMGTWLQQELSAHSGISALVRCQMPASFVWKLAEALMPDDRHVPIFEKNHARWEIFKRLPEKLSDPKYALLSDYLYRQEGLYNQTQKKQEHDEISVQQKVLFELSEVIADVFDAYQNYRPDWINAWESGKTIALDTLTTLDQTNIKKLEAWQADLWCSLYPDIALEERRHRSRLFDQLIKLLQDPNEKTKSKLPERVFILGLSALPPQWFPVMSALSLHVDIHFFVHNPCQFYWGDVISPAQKLKLEKALVDKGVSLETAADTFLEGNALLASWGALGRDYLSLLTDFPKIKESAVSLFDDEFNERLDKGLSVSALQCIQNDIQNIQTTRFEVSEQDDSICFSSCHSHLREVEALHDYLFSLLSQQPEIKPKDIIVMMPDVQDFAALIEAVFSRPAYDAQGQAHYLPYGISDQLLSMDQPLIDILSELLSLASSRITGTECLNWLEIPAIRSRFSITEPEMEDIKEWVKQLNVRWGLSESHRDSLLKVKGSGAGNTWLCASQRLLAGYVYGQEGIYLHGDTEYFAFPQRSPEKQILAGKLMRFLDTITSTLNLQSKQLTLSQWLGELSNLWQNWLDFEFVSVEIQTLLNRIETDIEKEMLQTSFDLPLSFSVVSSAFKTQFESQRVSQRFLAGRINFCTLMPMRSIPFKSVCMLGLNEGAYPRPVQGQSFDLLSQTPARIGDRSRREDDRYLFLEALCSARSHLYISYCGRDIQDNSERYPSTLVTELQSYCAENFTLQNRSFEEGETILDHFLVEHHLQPFHQDYYYQTPIVDGKESLSKEKNNLTKTFATEWLPLINAHLTQASNASEDTLTHLPNKKQTENSIEYHDHEEQFDFFSSSSKARKVQLDFERLLDCVSNPLRYYYRTALQVNLYSIEEETPVSEPFSIQGLDAYELKKSLVQRWFGEQSEGAFSALLSKEWQLAGKLPRAPLDDYYLKNIQASIQPMYDYVTQNMFSETQHHEFDFSLDIYQIYGGCVTHDNQLVELALSKSLGSSFFSFWLKHVFWSLYCARCDAEPTKQNVKGSLLIGPEQEIIVPILSSDKAEVFALECCQFFELASHEPNTFFPKSSFALLFESESKAKNAFLGNQNIPGESSDLYWQRYCAMSTENIDLNALPNFSDSVLFRQVESIKDLIEVRKIQLQNVDNKQGLSNSELHL